MIKRVKKAAGNSTRGESMVFAMVLLAVFLTIGVSVMTAAAGAGGTVSARANERQSYYLARSVLDALDTSLQSGDMGKNLRQSALKDATDAQSGSVVFNNVPVPLTVGSNASALSGMTVQNARLNLNGAASVLSRNESGDPTQVLVSYDSLVLSFTAIWNNKSYTMRVTYGYTGWAVKDATAASGGGWKWTETWNVLKFE